MPSFPQDLRYGLRGLRNQPSFALLALLALGLGIGSATTIFSVIQNVLLDPLPYLNANRVVQIFIHDNTSSRPGGRTAFQVPEFLDYKEQARCFEDVIGGDVEDVLMTTNEGTEQFDGGRLTGNTFSFLGVSAQIGRTLTPDDAKPGAAPVFLMNYKMWANHYGEDPSILGRSFVLNGTPTTLVGIMPMRFGKLGADLYRPVTLDRADPEDSRRYYLFQGRLKPGVSERQAQVELDAIAHRLAQVYPRNYPKNFSVTVQSWVDSIIGPFKKTLYMLAAAVGLLLLIACANVANMLLARASAREKEMAIRTAVGASRARLVRQLLIESLILALGGMAIGVVLSYFGIKALVTLIPEGLIPREAQIRLNVPVLSFSVGMAALTTLIFGLVPALRTAKDVVEPLKDSTKGMGGGFRHGKLRSSLAVVEVALSLVLLVGAGLLMRNFFTLLYVDLGLNTDHVLSARLPLPQGQYKTAEARRNFFRQLLPRLQALPAVVAVTETSTLPPYGGIGTDIQIPGKTHTESWRAIFQLCSEGYFPTLGLKLLRGRLLSEVDVNDARQVTVVNQTLVKKYFGQEDPIGRTIKIEMLETLAQWRVENPMFEIIGVVADAKNQGIQEMPMPEAFLPYTITWAFERGVLVRAAGDPHLLLNSVRREVWAVDRGVALTLTGSLTDYLKRFSYSEPRFSLILMSVFAGVGLVLVAVGVYSVIAYNVARQTHEIGIRMALGASRLDVLGLIMRRGGLLIVAGIALGLAASFGATRVLSTMLTGISRHDPLTLAIVVSVVATVGLAACYFPARRATRVEPTVALRYE